jgi:serine-type D-Ala-D-Ala carboxypeptidase
LLIGTRDTTLLSRGFGHFTWSRRSPRPSADSTLWDLASLTKVIATTGVAARLVDRRVLELDAPVSQYLPACGLSSAVTVRTLLDHTSGLPAWLALWREGGSPAGVTARICAEPLHHAPGTSAEYSDLNAILLAAVLEQAGGAPFATLVEHEVIEPLELRHTFFTPGPATRAVAAPTTTAGHDVQGTVNDENAAYLGGVAGHAGLFSTAADVGRVARAWLNSGTLDGVEWVSSTTIQRFLQRSPGSGTRLLGWDTPDSTGAEPSAFGREPDPGTYGHTGWTGTAILIDPARQVYVVFLTNRAFQPRMKDTFKAMRRARTAVADAVMAAVPCPVGASC